MLKRFAAAAAIVSVVAFGSVSTPAAAHGRPAVGALIGGGIGAAIGHSVNGNTGAWVGGALGALAGASIAANVHGGYAVAAPYPAPVAYVAPLPAYYPQAATYYRPAPVVIAPRPVVYVPPRYVVRPGPVVVPVRGWRHGPHVGPAYVAYVPRR